MSVFFSQHVPPVGGTQETASQPMAQTGHLEPTEAERREQVKCDEELLNSFGEG